MILPIVYYTLGIEPQTNRQKSLPLIGLAYILERQTDNKQEKSMKYRIYWMVGKAGRNRI